MDFISLFSGIGGFDLGLERAGMKCIAQVEIDKAARGVLATHYPHVERLNDVTKANKDNLPTASLICGGFPCQDLSVAGRRAGLDGERSGLWFEFARIIGELKPSWVLIENVPGLLSSNEGRDFKIILDGLVERGYGVCWRVLDAQYFGLAQRRKRLFIVASLGSGRSAQVLFEREGMSGDIETRKAERAELARDIAATLRSRGENTGTRVDFETGLTVARAITTKEGMRYEPTIETLPPVGLQMNFIRPTRLNDMAGTLNAQPGSAQFNGVMDYQQGVRRLTPTECERLQGFPDTWTAVSNGKPQADSARYKQLGNAVAVPVIEWIGKRIMDASK